GATGETSIRGRWSAKADIEHLQAHQLQGLLPAVPFADLYASVALARADLGSVALAWDRTSDPLIRSVFTGGGAYLHLLGVTLRARLSPAHDATLTFGRSRGGRACTAGTCYEVPPFDGAELRLLSRF